MAKENNAPATVTGAGAKKIGDQDNKVGDAQTQGNTPEEQTEHAKQIDVEFTEVKALDTKTKNRVQAVFEAHPKLEKVFVTSDKQIFDEATFAKPHSKKLEDKAILAILRS